MDDILRQLEGLFVGSVPTSILFLFLLLCYATLMHRPLRRTLAERRERTAGAVEQAASAVALADAKTQEYEARLRAARLEINQARERQIAGWNAARDRTLAEVREQAAVQVRRAHAALDADAEALRAGMETSNGSIDALAAQIVSTVLGPAAAAGRAEEAGS